MTDTPDREPETRLPARRPPAEPAPVERFSAPPSTHQFELTPERAAKIVRQSSSARWVGFLAVVVVALFVIGYYFYELGLPGGLSKPRLDMSGDQQQVVAVERGYNLYQANCARCHGVEGEGGLGPALNVQEKLYQHLSEEYLRNVLEVGGRYVCGNAESLMPVWSDKNGGPLNYRQIEELIAFLRAENTEEYEVRDEFNEPTGDHFTGWVDPNYEPAPGATPYPDCYLDALGGGGGGSPSPAASLPADATQVELTAQGTAFEQDTLEAPADEEFGIVFSNEDAATPHDVDIRDGGGTVVYDSEFFNGVEERTLVVPALAAGEYEFFCSVHPAMTGTLTVE